MKTLVRGVEELRDLPGDEWGVYRTLQQKLLTTALSPELQRDLLRTALTTLEEDARPAYGRQGDYLRSLAESAPEAVGIWQLPGGDDYYRAVLRRQMEASLR